MQIPPRAGIAAHRSHRCRKRDLLRPERRTAAGEIAGGSA